MKTKETSERQQALEWWNKLRNQPIQKDGIGGFRRSWDLMEKYFPNQKEHGGTALLNEEQIEEIWRKENPIAILPDEMINTNFIIGDKVIVFDCQTWQKTGDIGDNSQFYKPATVIDCKQDILQRWVVDVKFEDGRISKGHFQSGVVKDNSKSNQKQFKHFDKELFERYINKFSDEDKMRMFSIFTLEMKKLGYNKQEIITNVHYDLL